VQEATQSEPDDVLLRLSAQRALLGAVSAALRAVSVELRGTQICFRAVFDAAHTPDNREMLSVAATEVIADFPAGYTIDEDYVVVNADTPIQHLRHLVFLRAE